MAAENSTEAISLGNMPTSQTRGYPYLAKLWAKSQLGIARKYGDLAILNILYLQAELAHLEDDLAKEQQRDRSAVGKEKSDCDWDWLLLSTPLLNEDSRQWALVLQIRQKLGEYHSAVLQYSQIASMRPPTESQRRAMFHIIGSASLNDSLGHFQSFDLSGEHGPRVYQRQYIDDLILLDATDEENDMLSIYLVRPLLDMFHFVWKRGKTTMPKDLESAPEGDNKTKLYLYKHKRYRGLNHAVGAVCSAVPIIMSMVILYVVPVMKVKVGLVCMFTLLFCLALSGLSKARRIEVFAATAA